jgi:predicted Zn-dependent peptidase
MLYYSNTEDPGLLYAIGIANLGKDSKEVENAIVAEIDKISKELVSEEEFQMALAATEYSTATQLRTLAGVSQALASNYTYFKDTHRVNKELSFYSELTREDLLSVAQKYFQPQSKIVLYYLPK